MHNFDGYRFVRQGPTKGPRSTMAFDGQCLFQATAELQRMPIDIFACICKRRYCVFVDSTLVFSCFFCISAKWPSRFFFFFRKLWQDWQRSAPWKKHFGHEKERGRVEETRIRFTTAKGPRTAPAAPSISRPTSHISTFEVPE